MAETGFEGVQGLFEPRAEIGGQFSQGGERGPDMRGGAGWRWRR